MGESQTIFGHHYRVSCRTSHIISNEDNTREVSVRTNRTWFRPNFTEIIYQDIHTYLHEYHVKTNTLRALVAALITLSDCRLTTEDAPHQQARELAIRRLPVSSQPPRGPRILVGSSASSPTRSEGTTNWFSLSLSYSILQLWPAQTSCNLWLPNHKSKIQLYGLPFLVKSQVLKKWQTSNIWEQL